MICCEHVGNRALDNEAIKTADVQRAVTVSAAAK